MLPLSSDILRNDYVEGAKLPRQLSCRTGNVLLTICKIAILCNTRSFNKPQQHPMWLLISISDDYIKIAICRTTTTTFQQGISSARFFNHFGNVTFPAGVLQNDRNGASGGYKASH